MFVVLGVAVGGRRVGEDNGVAELVITGVSVISPGATGVGLTGMGVEFPVGTAGAHAASMISSTTKSQAFRSIFTATPILKKFSHF